jgi:hypothetical protein
LVSISNNQANTKLLKVVFRESLNARAVMDFNLFLSPNDTWTGAVIPTDAGAKLITNDNSCVVPNDLFAETRPDGLGNALNAFKNRQYSGTFADSLSLTSLDRGREGYLEVFEMGVIDPNLSSFAAQIVGYAKQDSNGVPANCAALDKFDGGAGFPPPTFPNTGAALMAPPTGGLSGRASLINATTGANYSFSPTALDNWSSQVKYSGAGNNNSVTLADANPFISLAMTPNGLVVANWSNGRDAVSAVLMRESVINEFVIDDGTASQTDWIVTFPTKPFYTDTRLSASFGPTPPFTTISNNTSPFACESYLPTVADREGRTLPASRICPLDPPAPAGVRLVCLTSNVVPLVSDSTVASGLGNISGLLGAGFPAETAGSCSRPSVIEATTAKTTAGNLTTPSLRGQTQGPNGKIYLNFAAVNPGRPPLTPTSAFLISPNGTRASIPGLHYGLPVIGLMLHNYKNANVTSRYGGVIEHTYTVRIE